MNNLGPSKECKKWKTRKAGIYILLLVSYMNSMPSYSTKDGSFQIKQTNFQKEFKTFKNIVTLNFLKDQSMQAAFKAGPIE